MIHIEEEWDSLSIKDRAKTAIGRFALKKRATAKFLSENEVQAKITQWLQKEKFRLPKGYVGNIRGGSSKNTATDNVQPNPVASVDLLGYIEKGNIQNAPVEKSVRRIPFSTVSPLTSICFI